MGKIYHKSPRPVFVKASRFPHIVLCIQRFCFLHINPLVYIVLMRDYSHNKNGGLFCAVGIYVPYFSPPLPPSLSLSLHIYFFPPPPAQKKQRGTTSNMIRSFFAITTFQRPRDVPSTARNLEIDEEMANLRMMNRLPRNKTTQLPSNLWGREMSNNLFFFCV